MRAFAAISILAVNAAAVKTKESYVEQADVVVVNEEYYETFNVLEDYEVAVAMEQGTGRDHTDWSWKFEKEEAREETKAAAEDVVIAEVGLAGAIGEYDVVIHQILSPQVEHQRNCQLHREEEMNLYYQCTQGDINNYALHHFGGEKRSYPRWVQEYNVCIDHIHTAKTLHLDYYHEDGTVTLEPCNPQDHSSSVYIGMEGGWDPIVGGDWTIISAEPLNPYAPCDNQHVPDMSGLWYQTQGYEESMDLLMGNKLVHEEHAMCFKVKPAGHQAHVRAVSGTGNEHHEEALSLHQDNSHIDNGCKLQVGEGHHYIKTMPGYQVSMNKMFMMEKQEEDMIHESMYVRVGSCGFNADETSILTRNYIPGVRVNI